jgi:hypothetical protein
VNYELCLETPVETHIPPSCGHLCKGGYPFGGSLFIPIYTLCETLTKIRTLGKRAGRLVPWVGVEVARVSVAVVCTVCVTFDGAVVAVVLTCPR